MDIYVLNSLMDGAKTSPEKKTIGLRCLNDLTAVQNLGPK
jgi:hypothetical protein